MLCRGQNKRSGAAPVGLSTDCPPPSLCTATSPNAKRLSRHVLCVCNGPDMSMCVLGLVPCSWHQVTFGLLRAPRVAVCMLDPPVIGVCCPAFFHLYLKPIVCCFSCLLIQRF